MTTASAAPPADPGQIFESLGQAVEAGVVEPQLAERLYKGEKVQVLAVIEASDAIKAYGNGNPAALKKAQQLFAELQTTVIRDLDLPVEYKFTLLPVLLTPLHDPEAALRLINHRLVVSVWADGENELWLTRSLPMVGHPMAMQGNLKGAGQSIAILDTGADTTRPELSRITVSYEAAPDDLMLDSNGHGSGVAGVIAAAVPDAQIIPVDIMDGTSIMDSHTLRGLNWVLASRYKYNIVAVNMSWGKADYFLGNCNTPSPYHGAFQTLRQARTMPIVAVGNHAFRSGSFRQGVSRPACVPGAVAVGGVYTGTNTTGDEVWADCTDKAPVMVDTMPCSSGSGPRVDILAPGANVQSAGANRNGTSIGAPHVAALSAILSSINPSASALQLETQLKTSSVFVADARTIEVHPRLNFPDAIRAAAPVLNDDRADATMLPTWSGRISQTNWAATKEPGELDQAGNDGGSSLWYRWLPDRDATVEFSTVGSDFNTLLSVYRVEPNGTSTLLGEDDDSGPNNAETSIVTVQVRAGDLIEIAIDGFRFQGIAFPRTGHVRFNWNLPNDDVKDAMPLFPYGASRFGSNIAATQQYGEPHHCDDLFSNASVWYLWSPSANVSARVRASGTRTYCVHVYETPSTVTNPSFGALASVAWGVDDQGYPIDFTFPATAGKSYWIAVDGVSHETACNPYGQCQYVTPTGIFKIGRAHV